MINRELSGGDWWGYGDDWTDGRTAYVDGIGADSGAT